MTQRGRLALVLGAVVYLAAWGFGSIALYPVATGLVLAVALAWVWVRVASRPTRLSRSLGQADHLEGDDVTVELELEVKGALVPASLVVVERVGRLGERATRLVRGGLGLRAGYVLEDVPRGRYPFSEVRVDLEDPFGLERADVPLETGDTLVVYPRLVEVDRLFSEGGLDSHAGRRLLLRRAAGFDLHSVREYQEGESLRKVHWPTTARRGQLMVRDFEDAPRDEVAVVLDAQAGPAALGEAVDSSFDLQVRAAGSILKAHVRRGRRGVLLVSSARRAVQPVHSSGGDWRAALELLAAAEPSGHEPVAAVLADETSPAARALELVVVTPLLAPQLVERLVQRSLGHQRVSLVYVDASSFAGVEATRPRREPILLRLQSAGVAVAVVRRGDDLAAKLGAGAGSEAAHA